MRRSLLIAVLALLAAVPAARAADAKARLANCVTALDRAQRAASFTGDMRAVPGAARLQMKFVLLARLEDEPRWSAVTAPGFGVWNSSAPGIGRYVYTKTVENLLAPASYRARMHFRWLSADGDTLLRERRRSRTCRQPDLRPDLVVERLIAAGDGWHVVIRNRGRTAAYGFTVEIEADGVAHAFGSVEKLGPRETVSLRHAALPCRPGTDLIVRVDAGGAVGEADEQANALSQACPL